jgi:hypothetical protein
MVTEWSRQQRSPIVHCSAVFIEPFAVTLPFKEAEIGDDPKEGCVALANGLGREEQGPSQKMRIDSLHCPVP